MRDGSLVHTGGIDRLGPINASATDTEVAICLLQLATPFFIAWRIAPHSYPKSHPRLFDFSVGGAYW